MKTKVLSLLLFFTLGLLTSCDDADDTNEIQNNTINGVWHLRNVSGGLIGINVDYNLGDVKWTFDSSDNSLEVENNILTTGPEDIYSGLDTGTYTYEIQTDGTTQTLYIDTVERGIIIQLDQSLKIDDGVAADGMMTEFIR